MLRNQFNDPSLQEWFDTRVATASCRPVTAILTPDVALFRDYRAFCEGTGVPAEARLDRIAFAAALDGVYTPLKALVEVDDQPPVYLPCRSLSLARPIRVAA